MKMYFSIRNNIEIRVNMNTFCALIYTNKYFSE